MKFVIMAGGYYEHWETPKQLQIVNGERIIERTIRLLKENNIEDICITSNDKRFDNLGVPRLEHENTYRYENGKINGYWLDAFYPHFDKNTKVTFIFGDVYFTECALKKIINCNKSGNILFGSKGATVVGKVWGEPFAYVVNDITSFYNGIKTVKKLQDEGKTNRVPLVWELYRYLNNIDVNTHLVKKETYEVIDDGTNDCDWEDKLITLRKRFNKLGNVFTVIDINAIGGGESFLYYMVRKYKDRDITIFYKNGDPKQIERLKKYARVIKYYGQKIKCKRAFFNYNQAFINNIEADEYFQIIHADYYANNLTPKEDKRMKYIAVSKTAAEQFTKQTGKKCSVCYNPIEFDNNEAPLVLMSATRLSDNKSEKNNAKNKGKTRIEKLANILDEKGVNYLWLIFTNDEYKIDNSNIVYLSPRLNVIDYMPLCDIFVQLSSDEAYCYSAVEANLKGVQCATTPCPVFDELKIEGIRVDFDLNNVPIEKFVKNKRVKYKEPKDDWDKYLTNDLSTYIPGEDEYASVIVRPIKTYTDVELGKKVDSRTPPFEVTQTRAEYLCSVGAVRIIH